MACPVCDGTDTTRINVRMARDSDLKQVVGSTWSGRNMARCNECGVLYDYQYLEETTSDDDAEAGDGDDEMVNCPDCGAPNDGTRETCSYCEAPLADSD